MSCQDAMALPGNPAAYNCRSGKLNKDLLLQRPLKAMLWLCRWGILKEVFRTPTPCTYFLGCGFPQQAGAGENTQHTHQPCLFP